MRRLERVTRFCTTLVASLVPVLWSCAPEATEPLPASTAPVVQLERPQDAYVITQNDPSTGCEAHETRGYGFTVRFDWTDAPAGTTIGYELHAQREGSEFPIVSQFFDDSQFVWTWCNAFVADHNLLGWGWRVRVVDLEGNPGEWSERRGFTFEPCRHDDGRPCSAPG